MVPTSVPEFILVEGLMGVGKSGVAQAITQMMLSAAVPCRWFFEMEVPNPVGRNADPSLPADGIARSVIQWKRFAGDWEAPPSAIVDGRLLNINVTNALRDGDSSSSIVASLRETMNLLQPRRSLLVYLYRNDLGKQLHRTLETRNDRRWFIEQVESSVFGERSSARGFELALQLMKSAQSTTMELLRYFPGEIERVNVDATEWRDIVDLVARRLGLQSSCLYSRNNHLSIEGKYALCYDSKNFAIDITRDGDSFLLAGHPWSNFGGADHRYTLVAQDDGTFLHRCAPIRFVPTQQDGVVTELWQKGWFSDWGSMQEPLVRIR